MKKPAHKDLEHPPGQLVNPLSEEEIKAQWAIRAQKLGAAVKWDCLDNTLSEDERTLGDYIKRKEKQYAKKLTFDEWFHDAISWGSVESADYAICQACWKAAQENK